MKARLSRTEELGIVVSPWVQFHEFTVTQRDNYLYLSNSLRNPDSKDIGVLNMTDSMALIPLLSFQGIVITAIITSKSMSLVSKKSGPKTFTADISINVTGPEALFTAIGETLTTRKQFLQHPEYLQKGLKYMNPQYFYRGNQPSDLRSLVGPSPQEKTPSFSFQELTNLMDGTGMLSDYSEHIDKVLSLGLIRTALKDHQRDGVSFILGREDANRASLLTQSLASATNEGSSDKEPYTALGGIYADEMGLGKTLTMLSAISVSEYLNARATDSMEIDSDLQTLINVWDSEIDKHFAPNVFNVSIFHGDKRAKSLQSLHEKDIVLTTYHTLISDWTSKRLLHQHTWNRIVLDEAHCIRNQSTHQFKAAQNINARNRWCVTGTPIQNSMHDLRSLLGFLHFRPFSEPAIFNKFIVEPLSSQELDPVRHLRTLLSVMCFRRTRALLSLPPSDFHKISVTRTADETHWYDKILASAKLEYENIANMKSTKKKHTVLFATLMELRRLCSNGQPRSEVKNTSQSNDTELRTQGSRLGGKKRKRDTIAFSGFCEDCCSDEVDPSLGAALREFCPTCSESSSSPLSGAMVIESIQNLPMDFECSSASSPASSTFAYQREVPSLLPANNLKAALPSSKISAVIDNVENSPTGHKNLIFTSWRLTLDALQFELSRRGLPHLRIDGTTSFLDRQRILSQFSEDPDQCTLLMTIGTGAVGLAITSANRVHLVEPQWNPSMEDQAIARVIRMGQEKRVSVFKYIMKGTVEESIVELQQRKRRMARISLDGNDDDGRLEDYRFVLTNLH
ncbi:hypothetical protein PFICI_07848 [Pestalotiopsis fici W106-1]|uniref:Uncharacterized protein n=1 Tax=Pestalotiopsis fici (strain W106-1 / CGMCC3.15140) TaxID=1229662 RepID=W3X2U2_PESFW|nr:uncharacterized protein PFICI_07848 [Pestalotiopsis fici W106-1]ETS80319.1 hypothetical protein PFICI_07848 [Pestalotiopsis fici W106-1]